MKYKSHNTPLKLAACLGAPVIAQRPTAKEVGR